MAFRANESDADGYEYAKEYLVLRGILNDDKVHSLKMFEDIVFRYGPVISSYPSWHPLISANEDKLDVILYPETRCGYKGLSHTVHFRNGFISCPYGDGQEIIDSVENLPSNSFATITAERLNVKFYSNNTVPILVKCIWKVPWKIRERDGTFPKSLVVPLMLENEVMPTWRRARLGETWESMRPMMLGSPHGKQSSLFVNQETGQTLKKVWNTLLYTGMFGSIKV